MRRLVTLAVLTAATVAGAGASAAAAQAADACPNAAIRAAQRATALPDCRAYEKVTPQDKANSDITFWQGGAFAAAGGGAVAYQSGGAFADPKGAAHSDWYVSRRGSGGWSTANITPYTPPAAYAAILPASGFQAFSPDLTVGLFQSAGDPQDPDGDWGATNLYLRHADGSTVQVSPTADPDPGPFASPAFTGASDDFRTLTFQTSTSLVPGAPTGVNNLYVWRGGQLALVADAAQFPDGASAPATAATDRTHRIVSPDGSQIVFQAGSPSQLWLAQTGAAPVEISLSQNEDAGTVGDEAPSGATFMGSTSAGGKLKTIYFVSPDALTDDATVGTSGQGSDLYAYDVEHGTLTDLVIDHDHPNGAQVSGGSFGGVDASLPFLVSEDGARIYFYSKNGLAAGGHENYPSLYLLDHGDLRHVGPLSSFPRQSDVRMSADGRRLLYLAGYFSGAPTSDDAGSFAQVYMYDVDDGWDCVSCRSDGRPSTSRANFVGGASGYSFLGVPPYLNRTISDDGRRIFFETAEPLVPQDTNGTIDVYEWEDGAPHLLSAGTGAGDSHLLDASPSGDDVFITTRDQLTADDRDPITDVYDVRVGGGLAVDDGAAVASCEGDACQGTPRATPAVPVAASVSFAGAGDVAGGGEHGASSKQGRARVGRVRAVRGVRTRLRVAVSGRGVIRVNGPRVRRAVRRTARAGTYRVTVRLTKAARRRLARRHHLRARLRVRFTPRSGRAVTVRLRVTFRAPRRPGARRARRAHRSQHRSRVAAVRAARAARHAAVLSSTARKGR